MGIRGRPRTNNPKIKYDKIRLRLNTILDIEKICEKLNISQSYFVSTIIEQEIKKYKNFFEKK